MHRYRFCFEVFCKFDKEYGIDLIYCTATTLTDNQHTSSSFVSVRSANHHIVQPLEITLTLTPFDDRAWETENSPMMARMVAAHSLANLTKHIPQLSLRLQSYHIDRSDLLDACLSADAGDY